MSFSLTPTGHAVLPGPLQKESQVSKMGMNIACGSFSTSVLLCCLWSLQDQHTEMVYVDMWMRYRVL